MTITDRLDADPQRYHLLESERAQLAALLDRAVIALLNRPVATADGGPGDVITFIQTRDAIFAMKLAQQAVEHIPLRTSAVPPLPDPEGDMRKRFEEWPYRIRLTIEYHRDAFYVRCPDRADLGILDRNAADHGHGLSALKAPTAEALCQQVHEWARTNLPEWVSMSILRDSVIYLADPAVHPAHQK